ncbi:hypothetical protein NDU88_003492 [Pleurodeles waltl]|uniref:Uncharacterized protein n=1 Tax=Pleurodeles waltl TaxID=8319 RepID=A0AAV7V2L5_PLEWA|nr:hypothetical protein NDU88_003492 [Pleurodeles waltl]
MSGGPNYTARGVAPVAGCEQQVKASAGELRLRSRGMSGKPQVSNVNTGLRYTLGAMERARGVESRGESAQGSFIDKASHNLGNKTQLRPDTELSAGHYLGAGRRSLSHQQRGIRGSCSKRRL